MNVKHAIKRINLIDRPTWVYVVRAIKTEAAVWHHIGRAIRKNDWPWRSACGASGTDLITTLSRLQGGGLIGKRMFRACLRRIDMAAGRDGRYPFPVGGKKAHLAACRRFARQARKQIR